MVYRANKSPGLLLLIAIFLLCSSSCTSNRTITYPPTFDDFIEGQSVLLNGWLKVRGEVMLYVSEEAMQAGRTSPDCISGALPGQSASTVAYLEGQRVIVAGRVVSYYGLPQEPTTIIPRRILNNSIISNFCLGGWVIAVDSINRAP